MSIKQIVLSILCLYIIIPSSTAQKTEILILGSDHLSQVYKEGHPNTDVLAPHNQEDIEAFSALVANFAPDVLMVEALPERQQEMDSLYHLYLKNELHFDDLQYGRNEIYQLGFRIGRNVGLDQIIAVNSKGGTSQSILDNGENIEMYQDETANLRKVVKSTYEALQEGQLSFKEFLTFLNQPEAYNMIYKLRYITPARVRNGTFTNPDEMVNMAFVDSKYIGAELISVFKNRDYKIYANIVKTMLEEKPEKMLLIIGVGHIGSLKSILRDDPEFEVVDANEFIIDKKPD